MRVVGEERRATPRSACRRAGAPRARRSRSGRARRCRVIVAAHIVAVMYSRPGAVLVAHRDLAGAGRGDLRPGRSRPGRSCGAG